MTYIDLHNSDIRYRRCVRDNWHIVRDLIKYRSFLATKTGNSGSNHVAVYDGKEVKQFLIRRVNTYVFRDPIPMMHNIDLITKHIMNKERTLERRRRLHFHHTAAGHNYVVLKNGVAVDPDEIEVDWAEPGDAGADGGQNTVPLRGGKAAELWDVYSKKAERTQGTKETGRQCRLPVAQRKI